MNKAIIPLLIIVLSTCLFTNCKQNINEQVDIKTIREIKQAMEHSKNSWNKGDFNGYMDVYWKSDSLIFMGINSITKGWKTTLERYRASYPDAAARGVLNYEYHSFKPLGADYILLIGKFILTRENGEVLDGYFSLIWKKVDGKWKIIVDHT
jgi:ketosteroid isomerase-like protein